MHRILYLLPNTTLIRLTGSNTFKENTLKKFKTFISNSMKKISKKKLKNI